MLRGSVLGVVRTSLNHVNVGAGRHALMRLESEPVVRMLNGWSEDETMEFVLFAACSIIDGKPIMSFQFALAEDVVA